MTSNAEDRIRRGLQNIGGIVVPLADPESALERSLDERRRRRRRARAVAAVASAWLVLVAAGVIVTRDAHTSVDTATTPTAPVPAGPVPNLSIELPGLDLAQAYVVTDDPGPVPEGTPHVQVFRPPGPEWSLPVVEITSARPVASTREELLGIGEGAPGAQVIDVNGVPGHLVGGSEPPTLGWRLADGTPTLVRAPGLSAEELVDLARTMDKRPDRPGWDVPAVGDHGLVGTADGSIGFLPGTHETHSLRFEGAGGVVELNSSSASPANHESRVVDSVGGDVEIENTTVRGLPAVIARSSSDVRVLWFDDDLQVSTHLIVEGDLRSRIDDVIDALVELDDAEWSELVDVATSPSGEATTSTTTAPALLPQGEAAARAVVTEFLDALRQDDLETAASLWDGYPDWNPDDTAAKVAQLRERLDAGTFEGLLAGSNGLTVSPAWGSTTLFAAVTAMPPADGAPVTFVVGPGADPAGSQVRIQRLPSPADAVPESSPASGSQVSAGAVVEFGAMPVEGGVRVFVDGKEESVTFDVDRAVASLTIPPSLTGRIVVTVTMASPEIPTAFAFVYDVG